MGWEGAGVQTKECLEAPGGGQVVRVAVPKVPFTYLGEGSWSDSLVVSLSLSAAKSQ